MRRSIAAAAIVALAGAPLAAPATAQAVGVGIYGTVGGGQSDWDDSGSGGFDDRHDTIHSGGGLVLDTASPYHPLGYRLSVGWERIDGDEAGSLSPGFALEGVVIDQDLTIDLLRGGGQLRVWAGPELRLGFLKGSPDGPGPDDNFFAIGIGPVIGFDVGISPGMAIAWKFGYLVTGYAGDDDGAFDERHDNTLGEGHAYASLALMFRTWSGERERPAGYDRPQPRW